MRKLSLRLLWRMLRRKRAQKPLVAVQSHVVRDRVRSAIEPLEGRIAPAALLNARTVAFVDPEGDLVTVHFSGNVFDLSAATLLTKANAFFKFDAGQIHSGPIDSTDFAQRQQLQLLDFSAAPLVPAKLSFSIVADTQVINGAITGDGHAAVGAIKGDGHAFGSVVIDGDLGQIDCGGGANKVGLASLEVVSIGKFGTATQKAVASPTPTNPAPDLESDIGGMVKSIHVAEDMRGFLNIADARQTVNGQSVLTKHGIVGELVIGGSLIGDPAVAAASNNTARISAYDIGSLKIGTDSTDGIFGGGGSNSGAVAAVRNIGSVEVSGNLMGGAGFGSGLIYANGKIGPVKIAGDVSGGSGELSANVRGGEIRSLTLGSAADPGSLLGGTGQGSASIVTVGKMGAVKIFGNVIGNATDSGSVEAGGALKSVLIGGSLTGGAGTASGAFESQGNIGAVTVNGKMAGGDGVGSGSVVSAGSLASVTVHGDLDGGKGANSGAILAGYDPSRAQRDLGTVVIGGRLLGDEGASSGSIFAGRNIGAVTIGTELTGTGVALQGASGSLSGSVFAGGSIESVTLARGIAGAAGAGSASIQAHGRIGRIDVQSGDVIGGAGAQSAAILAHEVLNAATPRAGDIGNVKIAGELRGVGERSGMIEAEGTLGRAQLAKLTGGPGAQSGGIFSGSGFLPAGQTTAITVTGAIAGGTGARSGSVEIGGRLGSFTAGSMQGSALHVGEEVGAIVVNGSVADSTLSAVGQKTPSAHRDLAIASIQIAGNVTGSQILAGYDLLGAATNADAQIGTVQVTGNWTASSLVAGVRAGNDGAFGTSDDAVIGGANASGIVSKIASVVIGGAVQGTSGSGDHFGFVAERIGALSAGGTAVALTSNGGEVFELGSFADLSVREVVATV